MSFELKDYQKKALDALEVFFDQARGARDSDALQVAFTAARKKAMGDSARIMPYLPIATDAPEVPQVCLRIPTGGGKTLMAAYAIESAARLYVGTTTPVVLWLVPSNIIRIQTRDALLTPGHPYREALLQQYPADQLAVLDITDCAQLRAQDFGSKTIVIVGTRQTLQVENTASRDVYAYKEDFEPHFSALGDEPYFERVSQADLDANPSLLKLLGPNGVGKIKKSFANLLAWHRPIVIVDEAHNARGDLSYEVFRRIRPACVIEWTATPARNQNVLYHVSAQELKTESMIKLPIVLAPHPNWQEAIRDAVLTREKLAESARAEPDYVRPIVLFQADAINGEVPVEVMKQHLISVCQVEERRIAVATGTQRELDGVNLFDPTCPIDFVITVEALKEGWDCSFAYVFCTVQNIRSAKDMEQLLGRVLRMPYARKRSSELLNRAYAHVCGTNTAMVADQLADRLVSMGFEEMEAASFILPSDNDLFSKNTNIGHEPKPVESQFEMPDEVLAILQQHISTGVTVFAKEKTSTDKVSTIAITGNIDAATIETLINAVPKKQREELTKQLERHQTRVLNSLAPSQRGIEFGSLPMMAVPVQGDLQLLDSSLLHELFDLSLANESAELAGFERKDDEKPYLIDIERGRMHIKEDNAQYTIDLNKGDGAIKREDLLRTLSQRIRRDDVLQPDMIAWLGRLIDGLISRGIEINYMARHLNQFHDAISKQIDTISKRGRAKAFQQCLLEGPTKFQLSNFYQFRFDPNHYPARWLFNGRYDFKKHFYPKPGELDDDLTGEETACAIEIDRIDAIERWVRNLELQPKHAFWLPTSTDRFYPDFVAKLKDGRFLVIEYKGKGFYTNDDSKEKRDIGSVWASASNGQCLFIMVTHESVNGISVAAQIRKTIG